MSLLIGNDHLKRDLIMSIDCDAIYKIEVEDSNGVRSNDIRGVFLKQLIRDGVNVISYKVVPKALYKIEVTELDKRGRKYMRVGDVNDQNGKVIEFDDVDYAIQIANDLNWANKSYCYSVVPA